MARKIFVDGQVLPAQDVNAIANPVLDGDDFIGHGAKIIDGWLSDVDDQIKSRFYRWYNRFKPSFVSGLQVAIASGVVQVGGVLISIPAQNLILPNNANSYIYIGASTDDAAIALRVSPSPPSFNHIPIASATTANTVVAVLNDIRSMIADYIAPEKSSLINVGDCIFSFANGPAPLGFLECLGQEISRAAYAALFGKIGITYGAGNGSSTFQIPDVRGYFPRFSAIAGTTSGNLNNQITLTTDQLPPHEHLIDDPGHGHTFSQSPHGHTINQSPHGHSVADPGHQHGLPGNVYDTDASEGRDGDGSAYAPIGNSTYGAQTNISIAPAIANISLNPATIEITANNATTNINRTRNTGSNNTIDITPRSLSIRCFIKF